MVIFTLIGILLGSYFGFTKIFNTYAINDTLQIWNFNLATASSYTYDTNVMEVTNSGASTGVNKITNGDFETDLSGWTGERDYLLRDEFTDTRSAGSVNGTSATPGPGTRTLIDSLGVVTVGSGKLSVPYGNIANDPALRYELTTNTSGRLLTADIYENSRVEFGFDNNTSGLVQDALLFEVPSTLFIRSNGGSWISIGPHTGGNSYQAVAVKRTNGYYWFVKGGIYTNWTLLYITSSGNSSNYPTINRTTTSASAFDVNSIRMPSQLWLPTPLAYDTFTRANGSIGNTETTGPDSQTTPSLAWSGSTWSVSSNGLINNPSTGNELLVNNSFTSWTNDNPDGWTVYYSEIPGSREFNEVGSGETYGGTGTGSLNMFANVAGSNGIIQTVLTPGKYYKLVTNVSATSSNDYGIMYFQNQALFPIATTVGTHTYNAKTVGGNSFWLYKGGASNFTVDDISIKELPFSNTIASITSPTSDVISEANFTIGTYKYGGLALNVDNPSNPQNFVLVTMDRMASTIEIGKYVGGVFTSVQNTVTTYVANAPLRVVKDGTSYTVYYNNTIVGTTQTISDAGIINNTKHGVFSLEPSVIIDNYSLWARGTSSEYSSIPIDDLTATQQTSIKYQGSGAAQLTAPNNDAEFTQSVNLGNTDTHRIVAYAYTNGTAVNSNDVELKYNGNVLNTTYTSMGAGWYQLTSTFNAVNSSVRVGVQVKANETVYLDNYLVFKEGTDAQRTVYTTNAYTNLLATSWDSFGESITTPGGSTVKYQLCTDDGSTCESGGTWKYWDGDSWETASNLTTHTNSAIDLDQEAMQSLSTATSKLSVKAILINDGVNTPSIQSITVGLTTDTTPPSDVTNPIFEYNETIDCDYTDNCWTNNPTPKFTWDVATDIQSGMRGYCLYLGTDESGNPASTKAKLGTSPNPLTGTTCQFIVTSTDLDLSTSGYLATALSNEETFITSNDTYYLNIKAVDVAGNTSSNSSTIRIRFDGTLPKNVNYISTPSGNFSNVEDMSFTWPTIGSAASSDDESTVLGWQYQINSLEGEWLGTSYNSTLDINYIPIGNSTYDLTNAQDGSYIVSGDNIIYFRTIDIAGNPSSGATIRTGSLSYGGQAPTFGGDASVTITPNTNTQNQYALNWPAATPSLGNNVTNYYYMVNTTPPSTLSTLQANPASYFDNGTNLSVSASSLPNVNKGVNTIYVVAIDDANPANYSPSNYITGTFTLDSSNPDNVGNLVVSDVSIKALEKWNVALSWSAPTYQGAGNLSYQIYHSTDGVTFTQQGTTSGLSYVDSTPSSMQYFYKIVTKDGANMLSSGTNAVSITPTGKWTAPADLESAPLATSITTRSVVISWSTSRTSDSKVAYGLSSGTYFEEEPSNSNQVTAHTISLKGLSPNTTYFYVAKWTDEDGNTGISQEKIFKTQPAPTIKDVVVKNIGLYTASVQFTSKGASKVRVYYGTTTTFGAFKEIETSPVETTYIVELSELTDGTKYFYKLNAFDVESEEYQGTILDITTLPRPKISNVRLQEVLGTSQTAVLVSWDSNTSITSQVEFYPQGQPKEKREEIDIKLVKGEHKLILRGLLPQTDYNLVVKGRDKIGNEAKSDTYTFTTASDSRPPVITELNIEGATIPAVSTTAQETYAQLIITWKTDEPSTSQVEFGEGSNDVYTQRTQLDSNLTQDHVVIISNLTPSKVYHLRAISTDSANNTGKSVDSVTITPKATDNALDLVILNLQEIFKVFR